MQTNLFDLTGRVALVTGGSKGLGKAMARGFAQAGADIVIASRTEKELEPALAEILHGTKSRGLTVATDMTKRDQVKHLARVALEKMGRVDILVNNAGSNVPQPSDQIKDADWDYILELNLSAIMVLQRALIPQMKERRWGRIIHLSSIMGFVSKEGRGAYSATKAAVQGLARAAALELGTYGITVNCIAPGPFLTDLPMSLLSEAEKELFARTTALGRWGQAGRVDWSSAAPGQRCGGVHHGRNVGRRWRIFSAIRLQLRIPAHCVS